LLVVTYDEVDPEDVLMLNLFCFGWPVTEEAVKLLRRSDRRYSKYFGLYGLNEEGRAVSQVLVLHIKTRTKDGRELVAGIQGVATLPGYSHRGYATAVMRRAHQFLREAGIRLSFLETSASLVAHGLYEKLDYSTITTFCRGLRVANRKPAGSPPRLNKYEPKYAAAVDRLFAQQTRGALGFVYRQPRYLNIATEAYPSLADKIWVAISAGRVIGYVRATSEGGCANVEELVAADDSSRKSVLEAVEMKFKPKHLSLSRQIDGGMTRFYERQGFKIEAPGWGRVMARSLDRSLSGRDIADLYGVNEGRFVLYSVDSF
jgi:predicted acetyltransferase